VVEAPVKEGYFFIGWNADLNKTAIFRDITFTALWIEGAYISQERLSLVDPNGNDVENYTFNASGSVKVSLEEDNEYDNDLEYTLIVKAPENAVSYVLSEYAEAAAEATLEAANDVSEGKVEIAIKITDSEAKVITGNYPSFIKWYN